MEIPPPYLGLIAALAAGLLVGVERGYAQRAMPSGSRATGFRTFGLIGLAGGVAATAPPAIGAVIGFGVIAAVVAGYALGASETRLSATTCIAGILTFGIGAAAVVLSPAVALASAGAAFVILRGRQGLHAVLKGMDEPELEAVARFVLVALVVLPLLPDQELGPLGALNPRRIWMVVVFVLGLSFIGYAVTRRFGQKHGILFVAGTAAIVSSTAVTAEYARRMRSEPHARGALVAGIALASIVMFLRVQVLALTLVPRAAPTLALALAPATAVAGLLALLAWRRDGESEGKLILGNPLGFTPAFLLAGLVAVLSLLSHWALDRFGSGGIAVILGLTGMTDVDAAVLTMAGLPPSALDSRTAGLILAIPVLANTGIKAGMATGIARGYGGWRAGLPLWLSLAASSAVLLWMIRA